MRQKMKLRKVATALLSSVMMLSLFSTVFTFGKNGTNATPVHATGQVEAEVGEANVSSADVIGYTKEGDIETPYSSFDEFFASVQNNKGTLYIRNDIVLTEMVMIPDEMDITFIADNETGVEIMGASSIMNDGGCFGIPTGSSLTILGKFTFTGNTVGGQAFLINGTLNLGEKDNLEEYPVIQGFSGDGGGLGNAIYLCEGIVNIYNAHLINNKAAYSGTSGGGIYAEHSSIINFYNGQISGNKATSYGGGIYMDGSTFNMYGGSITGNTSEYDGSGVFSNSSSLNMYGGTISGNLYVGNDKDVALRESYVMFVNGTVDSFNFVNDWAFVYYTNGGTFESNNVSLTEFPIPTREGYTFEYWSDRESFECVETNLVGGIHYHYAKWKKIETHFDDIAPYRGSEGYTFPSVENHVFAGWYQDAEYTTPIAKDVTSGPAYAKFVDVKVMDVKAQITAGTNAGSTSTDMRIVSTVDSLMYSDAGFMIEVTKTTKISCRKVLTKIVAKDSGVTFSYEPTYFSRSSKYFTTYTIKNIPNASFGTEIKVTPYWVTLDGTTVMGNQVIKTVNGCL